MDIISQLPYDVKDKILECLPTRDAARTAILSTHWKDVWLHHGRLVFDTHFFECLRKCQSGDKRIAPVSIINNILLHRADPVKKFTLCISCPELEGPKPQQSDIDCWCLYLTRNGIEELNITIIYGKEYKLPSCIISCPTIKQLTLGGFNFDFNCLNVDGCIFPCVTSLVFFEVEFKRRINVVDNFKICAPKLKSLDLVFVLNAFKQRWSSPNFGVINALCAYGRDSLSLDDVAVVAQAFPTANLRVFWVIYSDSDFSQITIALELLERSSNLCKLEIKAEKMPSSRWIDKDAASRIMKDSFFINQDLKMLKTIIKIESFSGSILKMHFTTAFIKFLNHVEAVEKEIYSTP